MKTCLVVDDIKSDRDLVGRCAEKAGFSVIAADSGEEALESCKTSLPDLVLIDWEMKDMNGIELLQNLRKLAGAESVPMIICTGHKHGSFAGHAYLQGASGFISKPLSTDKLEAALRDLNVI